VWLLIWPQKGDSTNSGAIWYFVQMTSGFN
jgi:hypothetical protein